MATILDVFQLSQRCLALIDLLPEGSPPKEVGLATTVGLGGAHGGDVERRGTYAVSYVRRLAGPTLSRGDKDPIRSMRKVEVYLDHQFGLRLMEHAIRTSPEWLGVQMQPRVINVVASPVK